MGDFANKNANKLRYTKADDGEVVIVGEVYSPGSNAGAIFNLPAGYRPAAVVNKFAYRDDGGGSVGVTIGTDGHVSADAAFWSNSPHWGVVAIVFSAA